MDTDRRTALKYIEGALFLEAIINAARSGHFDRQAKTDEVEEPETKA